MTWLVNCDEANVTQACSDWCEGPPIPPEPDPNGCWQYETQEDCESYIYNGCEWLDYPHPYFGYQCINWDRSVFNIGTGCREGTGCWFNCHGTNGWKSVPSSLMSTITNKEAEFGPVSEDWLRTLLDEYPDYGREFPEETME
jgi:hypothetical protein